MKQIVRVACCLLALLFCLPSFAQNADEKKRDAGVITTEEMKERLATVESDGAVITNSKLAPDETAAAAGTGTFTNADLGSTGEGEAGEEGEGQATGSSEDADEAEPDSEAQPEADAERERLIGEIESELDALAERVRNIEGQADDARLRETESKLEELRRAVEALKKG